MNGKTFYSDLNVTANGVSVYSLQWPLSGMTEIAMTPGDGIPVGPVINAGEIFQILALGGRTLTRDGSLLITSIFVHPFQCLSILSFTTNFLFLPYFKQLSILGILQ